MNKKIEIFFLLFLNVYDWVSVNVEVKFSLGNWYIPYLTYVHGKISHININLLEPMTSTFFPLSWIDVHSMHPYTRGGKCKQSHVNNINTQLKLDTSVEKVKTDFKFVGFELSVSLWLSVRAPLT